MGYATGVLGDLEPALLLRETTPRHGGARLLHRCSRKEKNLLRTRELIRHQVTCPHPQMSVPNVLLPCHQFSATGLSPLANKQKGNTRKTTCDPPCHCPVSPPLCGPASWECGPTCLPHLKSPPEVPTCHPTCLPHRPPSHLVFVFFALFGLVATDLDKPQSSLPDTQSRLIQG